MHQQSVHGLDAQRFEWVCGGIIGDIAVDCRRNPTGPSELMAPVSDGGIEAKVPTESGHLAVQCKAYSDFAKEVASVQKSFATFLDRPEHVTVDTYVWCSTAHRTSGTGSTSPRKTGNDSKAAQALTKMRAAARAKGRNVSVLIRFAEDLDRIIRERHPEYQAVMAARQPIGFDDVERYSTARASDILSRLGADDVPQLEFPAHRTSEFLDRLLTS
jgi:hypothetical protein